MQRNLIKKEEKSSRMAALLIHPKLPHKVQITTSFPVSN